MTRCRVGDLAIMVGSIHPKNAGKVVEVLAPIGPLPEGAEFVGPDGRLKFVSVGGFFWWVRGNLVARHRDGTDSMFSENHVLDSHLRPIRDPGEDAKDETLSWLPAPTTPEGREIEA